MDTYTQIRTFISKNILFSNNGFHYSDSASFLEEGIIDSQGVMELVAFVEGAFGISVDDIEITPDNFDSVSKLAEYIQYKMGKMNEHSRLPVGKRG